MVADGRVRKVDQQLCGFGGEARDQLALTKFEKDVAVFDSDRSEANCQGGRIPKGVAKVRQPLQHRPNFRLIQGSEHPLQSVLPVAVQPTVPQLLFGGLLHLPQEVAEVRCERDSIFQRPVLKKCRQQLLRGVRHMKYCESGVELIKRRRRSCRSVV